MLCQLPPKRGKRQIKRAENGAPQNHLLLHVHTREHTHAAQNALAPPVDFRDFWGQKIVPNPIRLINCIYTEPNIVVIIGLKAQTE